MNIPVFVFFVVFSYYAGVHVARAMKQNRKNPMLAMLGIWCFMFTGYILFQLSYI